MVRDAAMGTVGYSDVPVFRDLGVPVLQEIVIPQNCDGPELWRHSSILEALFVGLGRRKDVVLVAIAALHVNEQDNLILASRLKRSLGNQRTEIIEVLGQILEAAPSADNDSGPPGRLKLMPVADLGNLRNVAIGKPDVCARVVQRLRGRGEPMTISLKAIILKLAPVDLIPFDARTVVLGLVLAEAIWPVSLLGSHESNVETCFLVRASPRLWIG